MATYLPALRARMGATTFFVATVTLGEVSRLVEYAEAVDAWTSETPSELKLQRKLNIQRVEREMVPYLTDTDDHFYSALTVEVRMPANHGSAPEFAATQSFPGGVEFGSLTFDGTEVLYALDGQHRLKSIELAVRRRPELASEHITLILVPFRDIERSQLLFSDLNRYAKGPSKSVSLLFSHRDPVASVTKALADEVPILRDRVNMESTSLSTNSNRFITLSTLYEMTREFVPAEWAGDDAAQAELVAELRAVWSSWTEAIPPWRAVADGAEHPAYLRQHYLSMHGVGQRGIARASAAIRNANAPKTWIRRLAVLGEVDWKLTNSIWQGLALQGGRVNNTSTSIGLLSDLLVERMTGQSPAASPTRRRRATAPNGSRSGGRTSKAK